VLYFWGQRIWGEGVHFGNVPFKNFISFQKGNLLISREDKGDREGIPHTYPIP